MSVIIHNDIEQGSEEWLQLRAGMPTASKFSCVLAKGEGKTRQSYMIELASERITGIPHEGFKSKYMEEGTAREPQAIARYEWENDCEITQVGFVTRSDIYNAGVSPDGMRSSKVINEFKCPKTTTQISRFLKGEFPSTYKAQVQGQLWICEADYCDWVSFDPRIDGAASWVQIRVERDEEYIANLEKEVARFNSDLDKLVDKLKG